VPRANATVKFKVDGPGEIVATDNGDPTSFEPFQAHERKAFNGLCLVIVRAKPGRAGRITITASSEGLRDGVTVVTGSLNRDDR
jgi:beta-galactosidase